MGLEIRAATHADLPRLHDVERAAGRLFAEIGMPEIAGGEPMAIHELEEYADDGRAWVLVDADDRAVGYVLVDVVDGDAHIGQVSVDPRHHRQGHGRRLIEQVATWARQQTLRAITLTAFRDVPWNAPYYERCGFRSLMDTEIGPELAEVRAHHTAEGLDPNTRVCMRRDLEKTRV